MKTPQFVAVLFGSLFLDVVLLASLLLVPALLYHILMVLLLVVPLLVAQQVPACYQWTRQQSGGDTPWSALSRLLCGSSLMFLLLVGAMSYVLGKDPTSLPELLGLIYLSVSFLRFYGAGLLNIPVALLCLVKGNKADKISSACAILCSSVGFALLRRGQDPQLLQDPGQVLFMLILLLMSFAYGLVWGGTLNWLVCGLKGPKKTA